MKINLLVLAFTLILLFGCQKQINIPDNIGLETEILEIKENSLFVKSSLSSSGENITEHGHCWSDKYIEPILEISSFSCLGPLNGISEFKETLNLSINGNLFIRGYIIKDDYIIYSEAITVQQKK